MVGPSNLHAYPPLSNKSIISGEFQVDPSDLQEPEPYQSDDTGQDQDPAGRGEIPNWER